MREYEKLLIEFNVPSLGGYIFDESIAEKLCMHIAKFPQFGKIMKSNIEYTNINDLVGTTHKFFVGQPKLKVVDDVLSLFVTVCIYEDKLSKEELEGIDSGFWLLGMVGESSVDEETMCVKDFDLKQINIEIQNKLEYANNN